MKDAYGTKGASGLPTRIIIFPCVSPQKKKKPLCHQLTPVDGIAADRLPVSQSVIWFLTLIQLNKIK